MEGESGPGSQKNSDRPPSYWNHGEKVDRHDGERTLSGSFAGGYTQRNDPGQSRRKSSFTESEGDHRMSSARSVTFSDTNEEIDIESVPRAIEYDDDDDDDDFEDDNSSKKSVSFSEDLVTEVRLFSKENIPKNPILITAALGLCAVILGSVVLRGRKKEAE